MSYAMENRRVLLVDSAAQYLNFGRRALEKAGYSVAVTDNAFKAQALMRRNRYDLVLISLAGAERRDATITQIIMPEREATCRVVMISPVSLRPTTIRNAFKNGADDCIAKEYNEKGLQGIVDQQFNQMNSTEEQ